MKQLDDGPLKHSSEHPHFQKSIICFKYELHWQNWKYKSTINCTLHYLRISRNVTGKTGIPQEKPEIIFDANINKTIYYLKQYIQYFPHIIFQHKKYTNIIAQLKQSAKISRVKFSNTES